MMIYVLTYFIAFGAIGMLIGQHKGRPLAGLFWAMLLGPIGWLLIALGPNLDKPKSLPCPHCGGALPMNQKECNHCKNRITWVNGKARKSSFPPNATGENRNV